jgi:hypothetical protein
METKDYNKSIMMAFFSGGIFTMSILSIMKSGFTIFWSVLLFYGITTFAFYLAKDKMIHK